MKYTDPPYICDYLNFFIEKRIDPINQKTKDYVLAFHPRNGFFEEPLLSREELKGMADFIYKYLENNTRDQQPRTQEVATMNDENERSGASDGSMQPLAWGVMPGDNLPLWRCSSRQQAEKVVVWLREQRPASTPQAVPLVDGRHPPTLTDAEREAVNDAIYLCEAEAGLFGERAAATKWATCAAALRGLLERMGGGR